MIFGGSSENESFNDFFIINLKKVQCKKLEIKHEIKARTHFKM